MLFFSSGEGSKGLVVWVVLSDKGFFTVEDERVGGVCVLSSCDAMTDKVDLDAGGESGVGVAIEIGVGEVGNSKFSF